MTTIDKVSRQVAENCGFAGYNGGEHICVDLRENGPAQHVTISVKTGDGQLVTFSLIPRHEGRGHQCIDIVNHSGPRNEDGCPLLTAAILGQGPTLARVAPKDEATVVALICPVVERSA